MLLPCCQTLTCIVYFFLSCQATVLFRPKTCRDCTWQTLHPIAMSTALMTFLRNYHWKGYTVETIQSTPNMLTNLHRGKYPIHRLCHNLNIECRAFNLMEVCTWLNGEKWNILWAEDESWLPEVTTVMMGATLPHGFHKGHPSRV